MKKRCPECELETGAAGTYCPHCSTRMEEIGRPINSPEKDSSEPWEKDIQKAKEKIYELGIDFDMRRSHHEMKQAIREHIELRKSQGEMKQARKEHINNNDNR